ncbi:MAG: hypothetical protein IJ007_05080 [Oscillospiraceae bacterium]|nr:hypothetical protein [Oscillospiraceae bacterium]
MTVASASCLCTTAIELTASEYDKLAALIAGIETDIDGNHSCNHIGTGYNSSSAEYFGEINLGDIAEKYLSPSGRYIRLCPDEEVLQ